MLRVNQTEVEAFLRACVGLAPDMTLVQLALDGSWDSADARVFAYGGVVGLQSSWFNLAETWGKALADVGLESFHMVQAMNFRGDFARLGRAWGEQRIQKRQALLEELVGIVERTKFSAMGFAADIRLLGEQKKAHKKKEMFQSVVLDAMESLHHDYRIGIMCDREQDAAPLFLNWIENLLNKNPKHRDRIWAMCFVDDRYVPAAQVADLWTYLLYEDTERQLFEPTKPENPLFARLVATGGKNQRMRVTRQDFVGGLDGS